jgi:hypothetical protein
MMHLVGCYTYILLFIAHVDLVIIVVFVWQELLWNEESRSVVVLQHDDRDLEHHPCRQRRNKVDRWLDTDKVGWTAIKIWRCACICTVSIASRALYNTHSLSPSLTKREREKRYCTANPYTMEDSSGTMLCRSDICYVCQSVSECARAKQIVRSEQSDLEQKVLSKY